MADARNIKASELLSLLLLLLQENFGLKVRFFKKMQDWILKSERIQTRILDFFTKQINPVNPRSLGKRSEVDSLFRLTYHDPRDLALICLVKKRKKRYRILSNLRI